jgi:hypothetical protein
VQHKAIYGSSYLSPKLVSASDPVVNGGGRRVAVWCVDLDYGCGVDKMPCDINRKDRDAKMRSARYLVS